MLCRAVLTAVAISCTFSREVIGQGSRRKGQIKDLICVLWLSGMQREDLDINMLRKLQRHNVNIDDMSRESLKQQCLNFKLDNDSAKKEVKDKGEADENKTTTEYVKLLQTQDSETKVKTLLEDDVKTILTNLMDTKRVKTNVDKIFTIQKEMTPKFKPSIPESENIQNPNTGKFNTLFEKDKTGKFDVKYENGQPEIASIMKFWKMFTTTPSSYNYLDVKIREPNGNNPTPHEEKREHNFIKTNIMKGQTKDTEYISKLIEDFISKKTKPTTEIPTTAPIDLKKLSDQIEKLLQLYPQSGTLGHNSHLPEKEVEMVDDIQPAGYYFVKNGIPKKKAILNERISQYDNYERSNKKNIKDQNNRVLQIDIPQNTDTFPIQVPVTFDKNQKEMVERYQSIEESKINSVPTYAPNTRITKTSSSDTKKKGVNIITKDCIKEIAENVKAIVLKDLQQQIISTPVSTSVVTTTIISTTTAAIQTKTSTARPSTEVTSEHPPKNKPQEATQVLAKFMELFEQFKSIKEKTEITSNMTKLLTNVTTHQELRSPFQGKLHVPTVVMNPYRVKKPPDNMPEYSAYSIHSPRIVQNFPIHGASLVQINPMPLTPQKLYQLQGKPLTIQTNSEEIRPLGIPISQPIKLIHQNIVVTTFRPNHRDKWVDQYEHIDIINRKEKYKQYPSRPRHAVSQDTVKQLVRIPYKDGKSDDFENIYNRAKKVFDQNRYKNDKLRGYKYEKQLDQIPYKDERVHGLDTKPSNYRPLPYHRPYDSARYRNRDNSNRVKLTYDDVTNIKLNVNKKKYDDEPKHFDSVSYGVVSRNRNSPRFHEKLERVDDWRGDSTGNTEVDKSKAVASRQQQPLNMKDSRFDDTHFNNFLKTQQKVNDMLEKILSSKTNHSGARSVETT